MLAFIGIIRRRCAGGLVALSRNVDEALLMRAGTLVQAAVRCTLVVAGTLGSRALLFGAGALLALGNGLTQPSPPRSSARRARRPTDRAGRSRNQQSFASLARTLPGRRWAAGSTAATSKAARSTLHRGRVSFGMVVACALAMGLRRPAKLH